MVEGGATRWTAYDGLAPIPDFKGSGAVSARYLQGPATDEILARETSGGAVAWYLPDRLGTIRDLVDNTGAIIDHVDYGVFGGVVGETAPASGHRFKFTGMQQDGTAGLYYDNARWYDPANGRFVSQDPIGFVAGDSDLYRYVGNSPSFAIDPTGFLVEGAATVTVAEAGTTAAGTRATVVAAPAIIIIGTTTVGSYVVGQTVVRPYITDPLFDWLYGNTPYSPPLVAPTLGPQPGPQPQPAYGSSCHGLAIARHTE